MAARHKIRIMPVLFDDSAFGKPPQIDPYMGKQRDLIPGMFMPSWTPSPGRTLGTDEAEWVRMQGYVMDLVSTWGDDDRIVMWDLFNEPMAIAKVGLPKLVAQVFQWARSAQPTQPLTAATWCRRWLPVETAVVNNSDIITLHAYEGHLRLKKKIEAHLRWGRPVVCTEWMARIRSSSFEKDLPLFRRENIGCFQWGLVNGRTQAQFPWWNKKGGKVDPKTGWFHDILHPDGTPYRKEEIETIRRIIKEALQSQQL